MLQSLEDQELKENVEVMKNLQELILELKVNEPAFIGMKQTAFAAAAVDVMGKMSIYESDKRSVKALLLLAAILVLVFFLSLKNAS